MRILNKVARLGSVALLASTVGKSVFAGVIFVSASGSMPVSSLTNSWDSWSFNGNFSDDLVNFFGSSTSGTFEFDSVALSNLQFSVNGSNISFLTPTASLLDSRVSVSSCCLSFSLFFSPTDPFFQSAYANASFSISVAGSGPYSSDVTDLSTLYALNGANAVTSLSLRPVGGQFLPGATGTGSLSIVAASPVPAPTPLMMAMAGSVLLVLTGLNSRRSYHGYRTSKGLLK